MYRHKKELKKASGFTIIEVMIVMAVAGLIMAIVFLAVPALQRNNRNTQRSADASRVLAAVSECLASKNGQITSCDSNGDLDPTYITFLSNQQLTAVTIASSAVPTDTNSLIVQFGAKCDDAGATVVTNGVGARSYAAVYNAETSGGTNGYITRCVAS